LTEIANAAKEIQDSLNTRAIHTVALSDLIWGSSGKSLDRSISYLSMVSRSQGPFQVAALSDLSAAFLLRAAQSQDVRDLFQAIEAADSAVRLEGDYAPARFNLALSLEAAVIDHQALAEWNAYLRSDSVSPWATEAKSHRDKLVRERIRLPTEPQSSNDSALRQFARTSRQEARQYGWNIALARWGEFTLRGNIERAADELRKAATIAQELRNDGGDRTLDSAVEFIFRANNRPHLRNQLARAHFAFGQAQQLYQKGEYHTASARFREAVTSTSIPLRRWSSLFYGATLVYLGNPTEGIETIREVEATADSASPALKGRAAWMLGTSYVRQGEFEHALNEFLKAAQLFSECGEREYAGVVRELAADAQLNLGDATSAYLTALRALRSLRPYGGSVWVHNLYTVVAAAASTDGFHGVAEMLQSEGLAAAVGSGTALYIAEGLLARSRIASNSTARDRIKKDIDSAATIIAALPQGLARRWLTADLLSTRSHTALPGSRAVYLHDLDSALATFDGLQNKLRVLSTLLDRADAALDARDLRAARSDITRAAGLLESERNATTDAVLRQSVLSASHDVFARAAALTISLGDTAGALRLLEDGRASFEATRSRSASQKSEIPRLRDGVVAIEYLVQADTLFIWVLRRNGLKFKSISLDGYAMQDSVLAVAAVLESGVAAPLVDAALISLYDKLIGPIEAYLRADDTVTIVGSGWVTATPFAALRNPKSRRYLVQDHVISLANRLDGAAKLRGHARTGTALLVGDPSFDEQAFRHLESLPASVREVASIQTFYPRTKVLTKSSATIESFLANVRRASLVHYAGHAVVDPLRPMQSYLPLSSGNDGGSDGKLTGDLIRRVPMSPDVVVLSACETTRPTLRGNVQSNGLMLAFLAAGAKSVIGSLWRVDDESTRALMVDFHRNYVQSGNPSAALRKAQLRMLTATKASMRSPSAWSGFQLVTH
jgi:CHAT domain-containing protein/tetratricopeptide (TPR) repeat protein